MQTKIVVLAAAAFTLIYNLLFFKVDMGLGWGLFFLLLNLYFFLLRKKENSDLIFGVASSAASTIFAFLFALRSSEVVQTIDFLTAIFFLLTAVYFYQQPERFVPQVINFILLPSVTIKNSLASLLSIRVEKSDNSNTDSIIRGLVLSGVVIGILMLLLQGADPIFGKLTGNFFGSFAQRLIASGVIFTAVFVLGLKQFLGGKAAEKESLAAPHGKSTELMVILGSVGTLLLIFILVQLRYLFGTVGERELYELGINSLTYSEYVRKGFFELLLSSIVTSAVVLYSLNFLHQFKGGPKITVQLLSGFLTIETGLLLLSAVKRLALYGDAHGLTRARIFGFIFLVWLSLMLLVVLYRVVREIKPSRWLIFTLGITLETLLVINLINIDGLMTDKFKPTVNNEVDYFYLTGISMDASGSWKDALIDSERILAPLKDKKSLDSEDYRKIYWTRETLNQLVIKRKDLRDKYSSGFAWQSFNLSEYQAYQLIQKDKVVFDKLDSLLETAYKLDQSVPDIVKNTVSLDRSTNPPLTK